MTDNDLFLFLSMGDSLLVYLLQQQVKFSIFAFSRDEYYRLAHFLRRFSALKKLQIVGKQ
jgi:hypothetical protein